MEARNQITLLQVVVMTIVAAKRIAKTGNGHSVVRSEGRICSASRLAEEANGKSASRVMCSTEGRSRVIAWGSQISVDRIPLILADAAKIKNQFYTRK